MSDARNKRKGMVIHRPNVIRLTTVDEKVQYEMLHLHKLILMSSCLDVGKFHRNQEQPEYEGSTRPDQFYRLTKLGREPFQKAHETLYVLRTVLQDLCDFLEDAPIELKF